MFELDYVDDPTVKFNRFWNATVQILTPIPPVSTPAKSPAKTSRQSPKPKVKVPSDKVALADEI